MSEVFISLTKTYIHKIDLNFMANLVFSSRELVVWCLFALCVVVSECVLVCVCGWACGYMCVWCAQSVARWGGRVALFGLNRKEKEQSGDEERRRLAAHGISQNQNRNKQVMGHTHTHTHSRQTRYMY